MPWIQLTVDASGRSAEGVGERLEALGALAVSFLDMGDAPILEPKPGAEPGVATWNDARIVGLFKLDADLAALRTAFTDRRVDIEFLADRQWSSAWRQFAEVRSFGSLTVAPHDAEVEGSVVLRLEPGIGFGTGSHPSTRLCLEWLAGSSLHGRSVLDYGCGSGILAIAAKLLGAERVVAVDHDPQALTATCANAARNEVALCIDASASFTVAEPFDVVIANILSSTLVELAPRLTEALADGGQLVLSGILSDQIDQVISAYPRFGFLPPSRLTDWVLLQGERA